jgi:hypothetical protein
MLDSSKNPFANRADIRHISIVVWMDRARFLIGARLESTAVVEGRPRRQTP